jgi:hypothetical protein
MVVLPLTKILQSSKEGAIIVGVTLFEKPYGSVGIPKKFLLHSPSQFTSWKIATAYQPFGRFEKV